MSDRLTPAWTETLDEAFGVTGTKGRIGEEFLCKVFESWGWEYTWHQDDKQLQIDGIDITFRNPSWYNSYSCDVKANMDKFGTFFVYGSWLFKGKSDRIFHVNPDTGWLCWYSRKDMQDEFFYRSLGSLDKIRIAAKSRPKFITVRKFTDEKS